MFRIKICGLTRIEDVRAAVEAGADAIGLNFYPKSSRGISIDVAKRLAAECPSGVARVGVFVNATAAEIRRHVEQVPLDMVQLHGDEPSTILSDLSGLQVVRALRPRSGEWNLWLPTLLADQRYGPPVALLVDAPSGAGYGGTGRTANWAEVAANRHLWEGLPLILAGGLKPDNIAEAIRVVRPYTVDTASGVESSPGVKDPALVRAFVSNARSEFRL